MNIALLGYGTVGRGVDEICKSIDGIDITRILELPDRCFDPRMTANFDDILHDSSCELILECMGGIEPAHSYIASALAAKKAVVTSNKAVVAAHLQEFIALSKMHKTPLLCEAAVGGGVPWIASINKVRRIDKVSAVSGIMNGTTNYLLTKLKDEDLSFEAALSEAQDLGYAERDPSADIDGIDIANKIIISCAAAFNALCPQNLPVIGIRTLIKDDIELFAAHDRVIKFMARAYKSGTSFAAAVEPVALPASVVDAHIPSNFNILSLVGQTVGELKFYGQGAGSLPTGNAMVQDVLDYAAGIRPLFVLDESLSFDPKLLQTDYVLRTKNVAAVQNAPYKLSSFGDNAWLIYDINPISAQDFLCEVRRHDPAALIFAYPRKDC